MAGFLSPGFLGNPMMQQFEPPVAPRPVSAQPIQYRPPMQQQAPPPPPMPYSPPPQPQQQPFGLFGGGSNGNSIMPFVAGLGASMASGNPGAFAATAGPMLNQQRQRQQELEAKNRTYQYLLKTDPEAAQAFASGAMGAKEAMDWSQKRREVPEPKTIKGADGYNYFLTGPNQGKRVLPDVKAQERQGIGLDENGNLVNFGSKLTELQSKQISFTQRMKGATEVISDLEKKGYNVPSLKDSIAREIQNPLANYMVSEQGKQYVTAAREWIAGVLRLDSGAAVPEEEFWRYFQTYFPQAGDSKEVTQQKTDMRANVEQAINVGSGGLAGAATKGVETPGSIRKRLESMSDVELEAIINGQ